MLTLKQHGIQNPETLPISEWNAYCEIIEESNKTDNSKRVEVNR